jgi:hypothetical protein
LNLLLIQFHVEGQFMILGSAELKVRNYSTKNKDIAVVIPVTPSRFHEVGEVQRREFVLQSTLDAITAVERRLHKRHLNIDFDLLRHDVETIGQATALIMSITVCKDLTHLSTPGWKTRIIMPAIYSWLSTLPKRAMQSQLSSGKLYKDLKGKVTQIKTPIWDL